MKNGGNLGDIDMSKFFAEKKNKKTDTNDLAFDGVQYVVQTGLENSPSRSELHGANGNPKLKNQLRE